MTSRKNETRRLEELSEHPRQQELAGDISEAALAELARDMKNRGLQQPIEILRDGTIVAGHQRVKAAKKLGWTEIEVVIRDDLAEADDPEVLFHLVADNALRRQADAIATARAYRALKELDQHREWNDLRHDDRRDTRDRIGKVLGKTGRNLDRLVQLLDLPRSIQDAVSRKELTQTAAYKIRELSDRNQQEIATAITEGRPVEEIVREYISSSEKEPILRCRIYARFMRQLEKAADDLTLHVDRVAGTLPGGNSVALLDRGIDLLEELRERELEAESQVNEVDDRGQIDDDPDKLSGK